MPEMNGVPFEALCAFCRGPMCHLVRVTKTRERKVPLLLVMPCPHCAAQAGSEGYMVGHEKGRELAQMTAATGAVLEREATERERARDES